MSRMKKLESEYKMPKELRDDEIVGRLWNRSEKPLSETPDGVVYVYKEKGGEHYTWAIVYSNSRHGRPETISRGHRYSGLRSHMAHSAREHLQKRANDGCYVEVVEEEPQPKEKTE